MSSFLKAFIQTKFSFTSKRKAKKQILDSLEQYLILNNKFKENEGSISVKVPPMLGVDEDMREWSFYMLLQHNSIVNESITAIVEQLALKQKLYGKALIDVKHDVIPSSEASKLEVLRFEQSVRNHLDIVDSYDNLRWTEQFEHPIFGKFTAHKWHCMFGFHLSLHLEQAKYLSKNAKA